MLVDVIDLAVTPQPSSSRNYFARQIHNGHLWHVKIVHPGCFFRKQAALLEHNQFFNDDDLHTYQNLAALCEVVYGKFAMAFMPGRVSETKLCINTHLPQFPKFLSASRIIPDFKSIHDMALAGSRLSGEKVYGLYEIMIISKFLGDLDSVAGQNIGLLKTATNNIQASRIDFDYFGDFSEWDLRSFLTDLSLNPLLTIMIENKPTLVPGLFDGAKFPKYEMGNTLRKIESYNISELNMIWQRYKPLMLTEARRLTQFAPRIELLDFIQKDMPIAILHERQGDIRDMLNGCQIDNDQTNLESLLESRRQARQRYLQR